VSVALRIVGSRPRVRGECAEVPRPCPYVACRYNLAVDVDETVTARRRYDKPDAITGLMVRHGFADEEPAQAESCALDVADRGPATLEEVGAIMDVSKERVRQIEERALERLLAVVRERGLDPNDFAHAVDPVPAAEDDLAFTDAERKRIRAYRVPGERKLDFAFQREVERDRESGTRLKEGT